MKHQLSEKQREERRNNLSAWAGLASVMAIPVAFFCCALMYNYLNYGSASAHPTTKRIWVVTDSGGKVYYADDMSEYAFTNRVWMRLESGEERTITAPYTIKREYVER